MSARHLVLPLLAAAVTLACGGEGENRYPTEGTGKGSDWTITTTADRTSLSVQQGGTGTLHLKTVRAGGFTGSLTYSYMFPPGAMSGNATNIVTNGLTTDADIVISVPSVYPAGSYSMTLRVGGINEDVVAGNFIQLALTVVAKAP